MKHYVSGKIGAIGLVNSTVSLVIFFEVYFDLAYRVVGGIISVEDERQICFVSSTLVSGKLLMVNKNWFHEIT